ncbi:MAG: diaminopimelate epimerase [Candidatus Hydrogenedentes bacterium]|nr:diaminopimelate epimerase [Candidatus Hydrogenedentota bacterium]
MERLVFTKMHGLGNDYLFIDARSGYPTENLAELSRQMSHRHLGAGADGIILILSSNISDFKMRIFNADGSEAETCGNGIRCFAKYVYEHGLTKKTEFTIETLAGPNRVKLHTKDGKVDRVRSNMGKPNFERSKIPMLGSPIDKPVLEEPIDVDGETVKITAVNIGNPHAVIFVPDATKAPVSQLGPKIENHPLFPQRTNVEFVSIVDKSNIVMRIWERGSGITMASGSGSCASALASMITNRTDKRVNVHLVYGILTIEWAEDGCVYQEGPAEEVYTGYWLQALP